MVRSLHLSSSLSPIETSFVPALSTQPSSDDLHTTQNGTHRQRPPPRTSASTPASPTSSHTFVGKKKLRPVKPLSVHPLAEPLPRPRSQSQVRTHSSEDAHNHAGGSHRRNRPQSRDLPLLPPPLHPAPPPPTTSTTTTAATAEPHQPIPLPLRASGTAYGSRIDNNSSNTVTATTPRRRLTSADSSLPPSPPIRTVYEPIGGDAIRLGESNPLHPNAREDHEGEVEGRDEMRDRGRMNSTTLGGRNYTENGISRDGSVTTFHDHGLTTASMRGGGGFQDVSRSFLFSSLLFFISRSSQELTFLLSRALAAWPSPLLSPSPQPQPALHPTSQPRFQPPRSQPNLSCLAYLLSHQSISDSEGSRPLAQSIAQSR